MKTSKLPRQLEWRQWKKFLEKRLDYELVKSGPGSSRHFMNKGRKPQFFTCHEPHPHTHVPLPNLVEYLKKLNLSKEEFIGLMEGM